MRYVLDSCVALKWALPEKDTPAAVRPLNEYRQGSYEFLAPDVFPIEVARAERRGLVPATLGARRLRSILRNAPDLHPYLPLLPRAFAIASQARIGVYDCLYVALAEREGCEVLTADERLPRSLPGSPVVLLSSLE
ncbi:MAG: type II toxin-antitoxin system VapC family toxin [Isosphaeraceae bacterium]